MCRQKVTYRHTHCRLTMSPHLHIHAHKHTDSQTLKHRYTCTHLHAYTSTCTYIHMHAHSRTHACPSSESPLRPYFFPEAFADAQAESKACPRAAQSLGSGPFRPYSMSTHQSSLTSGSRPWRFCFVTPASAWMSLFFHLLAGWTAHSACLVFCSGSPLSTRLPWAVRSTSYHLIPSL